MERERGGGGIRPRNKECVIDLMEKAHCVPSRQKLYLHHAILHYALKVPRTMHLARPTGGALQSHQC